MTAGADGVQRGGCPTCGVSRRQAVYRSPLRSARTQGGLLVQAELRLGFYTRLRRYSPAAGGRAFYPRPVGTARGLPVE